MNIRDDLSYSVLGLSFEPTPGNKRISIKLPQKNPRHFIVSTLDIKDIWLSCLQTPCHHEVFPNIMPSNDISKHHHAIISPNITPSRNISNICRHETSPKIMTSWDISWESGTFNELSLIITTTSSNSYFQISRECHLARYLISKTEPRSSQAKALNFNASFVMFLQSISRPRAKYSSLLARMLQLLAMPSNTQSVHAEARTAARLMSVPRTWNQHESRADKQSKTA